jgi:hypothetical protein
VTGQNGQSTSELSIGARMSSLLIRVRVTRISVKQNKGKFKENSIFQNPVSLLLTELGQ